MDIQKKISSELFQEVRPACVEISRIALLPHSEYDNNSTTINGLLQTLRSTLNQNRELHKNDDYTIATKLADYLFFPLSNLLKKTSIAPETSRHILYILGFLLKFSWVHEINLALIDQLTPVIVYLCKKSDGELPFTQDAVFCLDSVVHCFPQSYFATGDKKRLSMLGDITTLLLESLECIPQPLNLERNQLAESILLSISWTYGARVTAEQASYVLPGIVSKVVSFSVKAKNIQIDTFKELFGLLQTIICKVFSDASLNARLTHIAPDFDDLSSLEELLTSKGASLSPAWKGSSDIAEIELSETGHRTKSWLTATSKQLKVALISLFKRLLLNASVSNKVSMSITLQDVMFAFIREITERCAMSLFQDVILLFPDILSLLISSILTEDASDESIYKKASDSLITNDRTYLSFLFEGLVKKAEDLVYNQLSEVFVAVDQSRMNKVLHALQFHLNTLDQISNYSLGEADIIIKLKRDAIIQLSHGLHGFKDPTKLSRDRPQSLSLLESQAGEESNMLDSVVLPSHINARSVKTGPRPTDTTRNLNPGSGLLQIAKKSSVSLQYFEKEGEDVFFFSSLIPQNFEKKIENFCSFVGRTVESATPIIEALLGDTALQGSNSRAESGCSLWFANILLRSSSGIQKHADFTEFVDFGEEDNDDRVDFPESGADDLVFMVLDYAEKSLQEFKEFSRPESTPNIPSSGIDQPSYAIAIQSIGVISGKLTKAELERYILMDYLYYLIEALTFDPDSPVHREARVVLHSVIQKHYEGSIVNLVKQNSDYLIDAISINLSVSSGLTPSLPGILLVLLKIAGLELLKTNQLKDIIGEIFLVVDSFHGYSVLIENLFTVLAEVVLLIRQHYLPKLSDYRKLTPMQKESPYKPWRIQSRAEFLELVAAQGQQADPFSEYDSEKEYFVKHPGKPFGDQQLDSDDDSDDEDFKEADTNDSPSDDVAPRTLPIPEEAYGLVLQIFKYGLQLLTHPSVKLRRIILQILEDAYIIVVADYDRLMPILADFWPVLMSIISGARLGSGWDSETSQSQHLIEPALQLAICIFEEDAKHGSFMRRRFIESWECIIRSEHSMLGDSDAKGGIIAVPKMSRTLRNLYLRLLVTALNSYERQMPQQTALAITKACVRLGLMESELKVSRDLQISLWVIQEYGGPHQSNRQW